MSAPDWPMGLPHNFGGLDENVAATSNQGAPRPTRREPAGPPAATETNSAANATANAE